MTKFVVPEYSHLSQAEMEVGLEVARVGIGRVDYVQDTITLDGLAGKMFGLPAGKTIARPTFHACIHPEDWPTVERDVELLLIPDDPDVIDLTHRIVRPDGETRWISARKRVTFDPEICTDRPINGVFAAVDVTESKLAQEETRLLIGELNHRSKNLISVIDGISRLLARSVAPEEFPEKLSERLMALSRNQDAMVQGIGGVFDMHDLLRSQIAPFDEDLRSRVKMAGPPLRVKAAVAQVLGMVVHELATNAVKYGALSCETGEVTVNWSHARHGGLASLSWLEQGGPDVVAPTHAGFGSKVLQTLPKLSLDADVNVAYDQGGVQYLLKMPQDAAC